MKYLSLFAGLLLSVAVQAAADSQALVTLRSELTASGGILFTSGASNTAGFGLRFGVRDRILHHLATRHPEAIRAMVSRRQCVGVMLDRFFPTAFPLFASPNVTDAELTAAVNDIVETALKTGCQIVVGSLFDPSLMTDDQKTLFDKALPLKRLSQGLGAADGTGRHASVVNAALTVLVKRYPGKISLMSFNDMVLPKVDDRFADLFQHGGDDIHLNYAGQVFFLNLFVRDSLERASGVKIVPFTSQVSYSVSWEDEVVRTAAALSPNEIGDAKILNQQALGQDIHQITGTQRKGVLVKPGDLKLIDHAVRQALSTASASFALSRHRASDGRRVYELDFTRQAYTKIELKEVPGRPGVFTGIGSDYWGGSLGLTRIWSPALTNYVFVLTEHDEDHISVEWKIVPQLVVKGLTQTIPKERRATLLDADGTWSREIRENLKAYDRLEYRIETEVEWVRPSSNS